MSRRHDRSAVTRPASSRRAGRRDFAELVRAAEPGADDLPLTHITDAYRFRAVVEHGELATSDCEVFGEPLLYLFYGRPAYRVTGSGTGTGLDAYWPICFVLRSDVAAKRIFPFDTGAFEKQLFADYCHKDMIREDFELESDPATPRRLVRLFWEGARSYFENRDFSEFAPEPFAFEAKSYNELIRSKANAAFDERHSAIELQLDVPLPLKDNLIAVIMPADFATPDILRHFDALGALVLPFDTVARHSAANMVGQIYDICRDLYAGNKGKVRYW